MALKDPGLFRLLNELLTAGGDAVHLAALLGHSEWKPPRSRGRRSFLTRRGCQAIIQDLLVFRADRERYYYGGRVDHSLIELCFVGLYTV